MLGDEADDDVFQFADVARKGIVKPRSTCLIGEGKNLCPMLDGAKLAVVIEQQKLVFAQIAQGRHAK